MSARLFEDRALSFRVSEGLNRKPTAAAQPPGDKENHDLIDLALRAIQGAEHIGLTEAEPLGNSASAELIALDESIDGTLARIELAQAVIDAPLVGGGDRRVLNRFGLVVAGGRFEELADRHLTPPRRFPEVPRAKAESGPEGSP
jgi:hypothetical protein